MSRKFTFTALAAALIALLFTGGVTPALAQGVDPIYSWHCDPSSCSETQDNVISGAVHTDVYGQCFAGEKLGVEGGAYAYNCSPPVDLVSQGFGGDEDNLYGYAEIGYVRGGGYATQNGNELVDAFMTEYCSRKVVEYNPGPVPCRKGP